MESNLVEKTSNPVEVNLIVKLPNQSLISLIGIALLAVLLVF
ncbi:MAG: hypothetical protein AAGH78_00015 [Cyanobacteria bacterium P01_H01_bin.58]